jgi:site-specific DNA recombinase
MQANPPKRAIIYVRISKDATGQGKSIAGQEADCREFCERRGWVVVAVYSDNDISAYSGKPRPGYRDLMREVKAGRCDVVVAWHTDRLHRSVAELTTYLEASLKAEVTTATVAGGDWDVSTADGIMNAQILGALAERESRHRSERVKAGRRRLAARGGHNGGRRGFGWDKDGVTERPLEVAAIKYGTKELIRGGSLRDIAREWNTRNIPKDDEHGNPSDEPRRFELNAVRAILSRARNAGMVRHQGDVLRDVKAVWEPIVTVAEWRAVMQILRNPERKTSPGNQPKHLGSFLYQCGAILPNGELCGEPMRAGSAGTGQQVYRCTTSGKGKDVDYGYRKGKQGVTHVTIGRDETDEYVTNFVLGALEEQGLGFMRDGDEQAEDPSMTVDQIAENERVVLDLFERKLLSAAVLEERLTEYSNLRDEIETAAAEGVQSGNVLSDLAALADDPRGTWEEWTTDRRRNFLREHVTVTVWSAKSTATKEIPDRVRVWLNTGAWIDETVSHDLDELDMVPGDRVAS